MNASQNAAQNEWLESMLGEFLDESGQLLDRLNEDLLRLDVLVREASDGQPRCDETLLNEMFRSAHSLKGLSGMLGLGDINDLTHRLENVLDAARKEGLPVTGDVVELMFQAVDHLEKLVEALKAPGAGPVECGAVVERIHRLLASHGVERKQVSQADAERALAELAEEARAAAPPAAAAQDAVHTSPSVAPVADDDPFADVRDEAAFADKYVPIFIDEAGVSLDRFAENLLAIENGGDPERLKTLLHVAHQIKGSAAAVGLHRPAKLAHLMEDLLQDLVDSGRTLAPEAADAMLKCTDRLRQYLENLRHRRPGPDGFGQAARELSVCSKRGTGTSPQRVFPGELRTGSEPVPLLEQSLMVVQAVAADRDVPLPLDERPLGPPLHDLRCGCPAEGRGEEAWASERREGLPQPALIPPGPAQQPSPEGREASDRLRQCVQAVVPAGTTCLIGQVRFQPRLPMAGLKAQLVYDKLANLGELCYFDPPQEQLDDLDVVEQVGFGLVTDKPGDLVAQHLKIAGVESLTMELLSADQPGDQGPSADLRAAVPDLAMRKEGPHRTGEAPCVAPPPQRAEGAAARGGATAEGARAPAETLRVDIEQLDELMNLAGQLVISKARFAQFGHRLKGLRAGKRWTQALARLLTGLGHLGDEGDGEREGESPEVGLQGLRRQARRLHNDLQGVFEELRALENVPDSINDLSEAIHQLDRVSGAVQKSVMDTRMVPIGPLFNRFKRVVRDVTRANGKEIRLVICGEKTRLDKRMIDELGDPLIHTVRNAADHGIESPEARQAAGKPREGTITLDAFHRGNHVVIQVRDDGAGLNTQRILQKCLEKGLVSEAEAQKMTPHQVHQMIWAPGLSTAEKVTEVSGRGMGMDIVKSKIELLRGTVDLQSSPGQGTLLSIKLPLTLAIQPSLLVEIGGDVFAMPMESVIEIVRVPCDQISTIQGQRTAWVRRRAISVVDLEEVFQWAGRGRKGAAASQDATIVIVGETKSELGLKVDRVLGEQDAVIKSISENYQNVAGISGASILGDGRVSLILDVAALVQMAAAGPVGGKQSEEPT